MAKSELWEEAGPAEISLKAYDGRRLRKLPADDKLWPNREYLKWHRDHRFERRE